MTDHERRWPIQESAKSLDKSGYLGGNSGGPMSQLKPSAADKAEPRGTFPEDKCFGGAAIINSDGRTHRSLGRGLPER